MKYSFHYLDSDTDKALKQLSNREKQAIKRYNAAQEINKMFKSEPWCNMYEAVSDMDKSIEHVVVKVWEHFISVYPTEEYRDGDIPWVMIDIQRKGEVHKYGSMIIAKEADRVLFGLSIGGIFFEEKEVAIGMYMMGPADLTMQQYAPKKMLYALNQVDMLRQPIDLNFNIPLFLPTTWKETWTVFKQTKFISFCK